MTSPDSEYHARQTAAEGDLTKLNLLRCPSCGRVYVSSYQGSKVNGLDPGWYDDLVSVRVTVEEDKRFDPVIRISVGNRGKKTCPDCG